MKKLFRVIVYLATFAAPAMIVEYYDANINPMSPSDKRLAIIGGTIGILIMAVLTGFGRIGLKRPSAFSMPPPGIARCRTTKTGFQMIKCYEIPKSPKTGQNALTGRPGHGMI